MRCIEKQTIKKLWKTNYFTLTPFICTVVSNKVWMNILKSKQSETSSKCLPYFEMNIIWICFVNLISSIRGFSLVLIIVIKKLIRHLAPLLCLLIRTIISMKTDIVRYEEACHCHFLFKISIKSFRTSS